LEPEHKNAPLPLALVHLSAWLQGGRGWGLGLALTQAFPVCLLGTDWPWIGTLSGARAEL